MNNKLRLFVSIVFSLIVFLASSHLAFAAYSYSKPALVENAGTFARITVYITGTADQSVRVVFDSGEIAGFCDGGVGNAKVGFPAICGSAAKNKIYKVWLTKPGTMEKIQDLPSVSTKTFTTPPVLPPTNTAYQTKLAALKDAIVVAKQAATASTNYFKANGKTDPKLEQAYTDAFKKMDLAAKSATSAAVGQIQITEVNKVIGDGFNEVLEAKKQQADPPAEVKDPPIEVIPKEDLTPGDRSIYRFLAPIGKDKTIDTTKGVGDYLNVLFLAIIGLCGALAVIMIVIGGIQYMGDESVFGKTEAKSKILSAILGLLIALGAFALLNTINPALTGKDGVTVDQLTTEIDGDTDAPVYVNNQVVTSSGIVCPKSGGKNQIPTIAQSFSGRMTYDKARPKGQAGPNNTIRLDCSGFVNYVLECAGVNNKRVNGGTYIIFSQANREKVDQNSFTDSSINGIPLQAGDLVGWTEADDKARGGKGNGHVLIYIGGGRVVDSHGGSTNGVKHAPGKAFGSYQTTHYKSKIVWLVRMKI